jgi:hypothetical protein
MASNYWMFVETEQNALITREKGYTIFGMSPKYKKRALRMQHNDRVIFYTRSKMNWTASATITSKVFEDESPIWLPKENTTDFKVRVNLKPNYILNETEYINGLAIGASLEYVKKWSPEKWPLAFWDSLHLIPQRDFKYIEDEMRRIKTGKKGDPIVQKNIRPRNSNLSPYNTKKHAEQINIR